MRTGGRACSGRHVWRLGPGCLPPAGPPPSPLTASSTVVVMVALLRCPRAPLRVGRGVVRSRSITGVALQRDAREAP